MPRLEFLDILKSERTRGEIAGIGKLFARRRLKRLKVGIGNNRLAPHNEMSRRGNLLRDAFYTSGKMCDIRSNRAIAARDNLGEGAIIVSNDERKPI